jgi:hypothetical protein
MRILLSEGGRAHLASGRRTTRFARARGRDFSSSKICPTRFTRHDVPRLAAAERIAGERKADLLFPTQEQVTVLSARRKHLRVATMM